MLVETFGLCRERKMVSKRWQLLGASRPEKVRDQTLFARTLVGGVSDTGPKAVWMHGTTVRLLLLKKIVLAQSRIDGLRLPRRRP